MINNTKRLTGAPKFRLRYLSAAIAVGMGQLVIMSPVHAADDLTSAITGGKASMDMRYRFETVDQDGFDEKAESATVRTRLGYLTDDYMGLSAFIEMEDISVVGAGDYAPKESGFPTVADPELTELNQGYLSYSAPGETLINVGRQRVILDNARFVGNVGWRQNEQTYDLVLLQNKGISDTTLTYAYVHRVNDVKGDNLDVDTHLLNASYAGLSFVKITAYGYLIDYETDAVAEDDIQTIGLRLSGGAPLSDDFKLLYSAEYANQSDYQDNERDIDVNYTLLEIGGELFGVTAKIGQETLEGQSLDGGGKYGFQTPLATKHGFNGWADKFLTTPGDGIVDQYVSIGGNVADVKLQAVYHQYSADVGGDDWGNELNVLAAMNFGKHYQLGAKLANYNADEHATDTEKVWLWGQLKF